MLICGDVEQMAVRWQPSIGLVVKCDVVFILFDICLFSANEPHSNEETVSLSIAPLRIRT